MLDPIPNKREKIFKKVKLDKVCSLSEFYDHLKEMSMFHLDKDKKTKTKKNYHQDAFLLEMVSNEFSKSNHIPLLELSNLSKDSSRRIMYMEENGNKGKESNTLQKSNVLVREDDNKKEENHKEENKKEKPSLKENVSNQSFFSPEEFKIALQCNLFKLFLACDSFYNNCLIRFWPNHQNTKKNFKEKFEFQLLFLF